MTFRPRNAYYLRISTTTILPLYLYLDERHRDWMSDTVLQHVLADLRPLVIPKLHAERDIHFGPGATPGSRKGTVAVHRGESYHFAYFFRKTEPHSVVIKSRNFVAAPTMSEVGPAPVAWSRKGEGRKRRRDKLPANQRRHKRPKTKGKSKASDSYLREDEELLSSEGSAEEEIQILPQDASGMRRRSQRGRRVVVGGYREDSEDELGSDDHRPISYTNNPQAAHTSLPTNEIKVEDVDEQTGGDADMGIGSDQSSAATQIDLTVEEEERKPKPLLKLHYKSFNLSGHCLCVVVEPWPPKRLATGARPITLGPPNASSSDTSIGGERTQTPLFLPECDRAPSEAPFPQARVLPPASLFNETGGCSVGDGYGSDDLIRFSQVLNSTGQAHANLADDDEEMEGAVLFGDADEVRELL
ncbi:hypothetical protein F5I97DRAFT_1804618 [Phlebopus sp. FC_14]|nr:hypothetical protein F5I97DRAFT_1804618 [Phlebopus sp. FC_14]